MSDSPNMQLETSPELKVSHCVRPFPGGFFSCCSVLLKDIVRHVGAHNQLIPCNVNVDELFELYKPGFGQFHKPHEQGPCVMYKYFQHPDGLDISNMERPPVGITTFDTGSQYFDYEHIKYAELKPFLKKYFTPANRIQSLSTRIKKRYRIDPTNTCVLLYRGLDKKTETKVCSYEEMLSHARGIKHNFPDIKFMIQSDETEFYEFMEENLPNTFSCCSESRHVTNTRSHPQVARFFIKDSGEIGSNYFAITLIMAQCRFIISNHSGNCILWTCLFRKNAKGVTQFSRNGEWITHSE